MSRYFLFLLCYCITFNSVAAENTQPSKPVYNAELAERLGADQYGMKSYILVILTTGKADAEITDEKQRQSLFSGHFANMSRLAEEQKLVLAGPFIESRPKRGLLILNTTSMEEAKKLVSSDPAIQAGILGYELSKYYGSAALMEVNKLHKTIQKTNIE